MAQLLEPLHQARRKLIQSEQHGIEDKSNYHGEKNRIWKLSENYHILG